LIQRAAARLVILHYIDFGSITIISAAAAPAWSLGR